MPTLHRLGSVSIRMYGRSSPAHFHIVAPDFHAHPDFQSLVRISVLTVIAGDAMPSQIAEARAWAETRQEWLALKCRN
jgi:hypothetical protein